MTHLSRALSSTLVAGATLALTSAVSPTHAVAPGAAQVALTTAPATTTDTATTASYRVTTDMNVRSGPGTGYTILGRIAQGTVVSGTMTSTGWLRFTWSGSTAYLAGSYLTKVTSTTSTTYEVVGTTALSVRSGPGTWYARLGYLAGGARITGTRLSSGWVRFTYSGQTAYVSSAYLREVTSSTGITVTRHVASGYGLHVSVYSTKIASSTYKAHYLARGAMVKGVIEGSWFKMSSNRYVPMSSLTTYHTPYDGTNGRHSPSSLCPMQGSAHASHVLIACSAVSDLRALNQAYTARFGGSFPWQECYRTYDTQVAYRNAYGTTAAIPGTSNHGTLTRPACDTPGGSTWGFGSTREQWLLAVGPSYGWIRPSWAQPWGTKPESWHFEYVGRTAAMSTAPAGGASTPTAASASTPDL